MNNYISFVNMDHRTDRLNHMEGELQKVGLKAVRTRGIRPEEVEAKREDIETMLQRTPGAVGCHFSQVSIIKEAYERGQNAFVMEDDIVFCEDFNKRMDYIEEWMQKNEWDIFWLGSAFHVNPPYWHPKGPSNMSGCRDISARLGYDAKRTEDPRIMRTYGAYDTFAYIVRYESIPKVLNGLNDFLKHSIGIDYAMIYLQPRELKTFCFLPGLIYQMDNISDIGTGMTVWSGQFDRGPYVWQNKMEDFNPETFNWAEAN